MKKDLRTRERKQMRLRRTDEKSLLGKPVKKDFTSKRDDHMTAHTCTLDDKVRVQEKTHKSGNKHFPCGQCKETFVDKKDLRKHQQAECTVTLLCELCGKSFETSKGLQSHKKTHSVDKPQTKQFKCRECGKEYRTRGDLRLHGINHHGVKSSFSCQLCNKHFLNNSRLSEHVRIAHTGEKVFLCSRCGKGFTCSRNLKRHLLEPNCISHGEKYMCKKCSKTCKSKYSLLYHVNRHHGNKPFRCKFCDQRYVTKEYCEKHEISHEGVYGVLPKKKVLKEVRLDFQCVQCDKAYGNRHLLARHRLLHTGEKPHVCSICSKGFRCKSTLTEHERIHSGVKPFVCQYCQTAFRLSGHLRYHLKALHKIQDVGRLKKAKTDDLQDGNTDGNSQKDACNINKVGGNAVADHTGQKDDTAAEGIIFGTLSDVDIDTSTNEPHTLEPTKSIDKLEDLQVQPSVPSNVNQLESESQEPSDVNIADGGRTEELLNMLMQGSWLQGQEQQDEGIRDVLRTGDQYSQNQIFQNQYPTGFDGRGVNVKSHMFQDPLGERSYLFGSLQCQPIEGHQSLQQILYDPQHVKGNPYACVTSEKKASIEVDSIPQISYVLQQGCSATGANQKKASFESDGIPPIEFHHGHDLDTFIQGQKEIPSVLQQGCNATGANQKKASFESVSIPPIEFHHGHDFDTFIQGQKAIPPRLPSVLNLDNNDNVHQPQYKELKTRCVQQIQQQNLPVVKIDSAVADTSHADVEHFQDEPRLELENGSVNQSLVKSYETSNEPHIQTTLVQQTDLQSNKVVMLKPDNDDNKLNTEQLTQVFNSAAKTALPNDLDPQIHIRLVQQNDELNFETCTTSTSQSRSHLVDGRNGMLSTCTTRVEVAAKQHLADKSICEITSFDGPNNNTESLILSSNMPDVDVPTTSRVLQDSSEILITSNQSIDMKEPVTLDGPNLIVIDDSSGTLAAEYLNIKKVLTSHVLGDSSEASTLPHPGDNIKENMLPGDSLLKVLDESSHQTLAAIDEVIENESKSYKPIEPMNPLDGSVAVSNVVKESLSELTKHLAGSQVVVGEVTVSYDHGLDKDQHSSSKETDLTAVVGEVTVSYDHSLDKDQHSSLKETDLTASGTTDVDGFHRGKCSATFSSKGDLDDHVRSHIETTQRDEEDVQEMNASQKVEKQVDRNKTGCKNVDYRGSKLSEHLCEICGKSYQTKSSLRYHKKSHSTKLYNCVTCEQTFTSWNAMRLHNINRHDGDPPHKCTVCGKGFLHEAKLEEHVRIQHTREMPFSCPNCSKTFTCRRNLKRHLNEPTCVPSKERIPCDQCQKTCKTQYSLDYHKALHHTQRPYHCEMCGKGYATKENCIRHENNHGELPPSSKTPKPTVKDHVCKICNKAYGNKHFLARHSQTHTGDKPFQCNECSKAFLYKSALKEHLRTHTGEKPYMCQHCGVSFRLGGHLRYHIKAVHEGDKPFSCTVCGKGFIFQSTMLNHVKTHTEGINKVKVQGKASGGECRTQKNPSNVIL